MEHEGKCPKCGTLVKVEEFPGNVVFVVNGKAVHDCPKCGETLLYAEVIGIKPDVEPVQ
jgi:predicted RNA-binding Zn-ribbon protein involved in translation (DUF1610 family)